MNEDKVQLAINKYEKRFQKFMAKMNKDVNNDKAFKCQDGNVFCGFVVQMRNEMDKFLKYARKGK
jgi:hypothetical protein